MNDSIVSYINNSKVNLNTIVESLEKNIEYLDNDLWSSYSQFKDSVNEIIKIYYDKYFLYNSNDFSKINKYMDFSNKINRRLKTILLAIIDYYEEKNEGYIINEKEGSILYLNILIYLGIIIYNKNISSLDTPKKIEKVINDVIDNFQKIRFRKEKDLVSLLNDINELVLENNNFEKLVNSLSSDKSHNVFVKIDDKNNYYKVVYEFDIDNLEKYLEKDIRIVNEKLNIKKELTDISFDLCYYASFKLLKKGLNSVLLFPISKSDLMDMEFINKINSLYKGVLNNIRFLVNYSDIRNDYEFVNFIREKNFDIYIDVNTVEETNNYNMFMDIRNIIVLEEFLSVNEKYVEIWKDMGIQFIIKNLGKRLTLDELMSRK